MAIAVARALAAVVMVLLWRNDVWLLVAAGGAVTVVLVRHRVVDHLWWRPVRVALLALDRTGAASGWAREPDRAVPDLVVEARGQTRVLEQAGDVLRDSDDLRRWAVGSERLAVAHRLIADMAPFVLAGHRQRSVWTLSLWAVGTGIAAVAVASGGASGGGGWAPIGFVAAFTGTTVVLTDLREQRQWRPMLVAWLAGAMKDNHCDGRAHSLPAQHLAETAAKPSVTRRAIRILSHFGEMAADQRSAAVGALEAAHEQLAHGPRCHRLSVIVPHIPYLVAGWLTWWVTA